MPSVGRLRPAILVAAAAFVISDGCGGRKVGVTKSDAGGPNEAGVDVGSTDVTDSAGSVRAGGAGGNAGAGGAAGQGGVGGGASTCRSLSVDACQGDVNCYVVNAVEVDAERSCWLDWHPVGCVEPTAKCSQSFARAMDPSGKQWQFPPDACVPPGWVIVAGGIVLRSCMVSDGGV